MIVTAKEYTGENWADFEHPHVFMKSDFKLVNSDKVVQTLDNTVIEFIMAQQRELDELKESVRAKAIEQITQSEIN